MVQRLGSLSPGQQRLILVLLCLVLFGIWSRWVPLIEVDEVRYVEATRQMFVRHDFVIPTFNDLPRYQKPILYYWIQASSMAVFGQNEFAARLPSALFGVLLVLAFHAFLLRLLGGWARERDEAWQRTARATALLGAAALATLPLLAPWTRIAITDVTLTAFITGSLLSLLLAELEPAAARRWYLLAAVFCGLSFLTKGPIGIAIPGLVWVAYHLRQGSLRAEAPRVPWLAAVGIVLLINLPWYCLTYFQVGFDFLRQFFFAENAARYMEGAEEHLATFSLENVKKILEFLAGVTALLFPYGAYVAHELSTPFCGYAALRGDTRLARARRFAAVWVLVVLVLFSLSKTRGLNYAQSISAGVALLFSLHLVGRFSPDAARLPRLRRSVIIERVMLCFFGAVITAALILPLTAGSANRRSWDEPFSPTAVATLLSLTAVAAIAFFASQIAGWATRRDDWQIGGAMLTWSAMLAILLIGFAPTYFASSFVPVARLGTYLRTQHPNEARFFTYFTKSPKPPQSPEGLIYYSQRPVVFDSTKNAAGTAVLEKQIATYREILLITDRQGLALVRPLADIEVLQQFDYFTVCRVKHRESRAPSVMESPDNPYRLLR